MNSNESEVKGQDDKKLALRCRIRHCLAFLLRTLWWGEDDRNNPQKKDPVENLGVNRLKLQNIIPMKNNSNKITPATSILPIGEVLFAYEGKNMSF